MATKLLQLAEIFSFLPKSHRKAGDGLASGTFPFFTSSQTQSKWFNEADYPSEAIILGTGGAPSVHCSKNFSTSADVFILAPKQKKILAKYAYYFFVGNKDVLSRGFKGAGLKHLSREYTEKIQIPVPIDKNGNPDLVEQKRIVAILEQAEELKNKRAEADRKMAELVPALFDKMFGNPETKTNKFPLVELSSVSKYITDGTHQPPKFTEAGVPFLFVKNITSGKIDFDTEKFISEETYQDLTKKYKPKVGNILYSTVGSYGVAVEIKEDRKFSFQRHIGHICPDASKINSDFLTAQLNTPFLRKQADLRARGVAQKTVNLQEIKKFKILLPPIELQNQFAKKVKLISESKASHEFSFAGLEALTESLMKKLVLSYN